MSRVYSIKVSGKRLAQWIICVCLMAFSNDCLSQVMEDSVKKTTPGKNIIRYNLSAGLLFGFDRSIVFGYERMIRKNQSISVNFGKASMPKLITIGTDSFTLNKDTKNKGTNFSIDYRFYVPRENKYHAPHGLYIGPYYSYNDLSRDNQWDYKNPGNNTYIITQTKLSIHTIGFELGYQFILWKCLALDFLMIGPGIGFYDYKARFDGNVDPAKKEQLYDALEQLLTQKFPGMNYVFSDDEIDASGAMKSTRLGYRYIIHIGFNF